jgi:hypothetical protein
MLNTHRFADRFTKTVRSEEYKYRKGKAGITKKGSGNYACMHCCSS